MSMTPLSPLGPPEGTVRVDGKVGDSSSPLGPPKGTVASTGGAAPGAGKKGRKPATTIQGIVISARMQKTITVETMSLEMHPRYKKYIRRKVRFKAHDEDRRAGEGDVVRIARTRPISLTKRWRLVEVVSKAKR